jgi:hypothetical protein
MNNEMNMERDCGDCNLLCTKEKKEYAECACPASLLNNAVQCANKKEQNAS